ncbi:putative porin, partial [Escherichia coli]|uniref:putative porin n=1 Tax=Escherichia coli TaxID=562 RepID=UPI002117871C
INVSQSAVNQPLPPLLNTTQDRQATRFRFRFGLLANVADDLSATVRLTTGNNVNPLSPNQTVGNAYNKFTLVIDRAFLNYHPLDGLNVYGGRIPNP